MILPVEVLLAVDVAVLDEARHLCVQRQFALATLEAGRVPLAVHGDQVVAIRDAASAAVAHGGVGTGARARGGRPHRVSLLQHRSETPSAAWLHLPTTRRPLSPSCSHMPTDQQSIGLV